MKKPQIDETKIPEVMELIDQAARLMEMKDCETDKEARKELMDLQSRLRAITGNKKLKIHEYQAYWSYTVLETAARMALHHPPQKSNLTDAQLKELILKICKMEFSEADNDYFLKVLEVETGLDNITDYIYNPDEVGMKLDASFEEISERIIADKK